MYFRSNNWAAFSFMCCSKFFCLPFSNIFQTWEQYGISILHDCRLVPLPDQNVLAQFPSKWSFHLFAAFMFLIVEMDGVCSVLLQSRHARHTLRTNESWTCWLKVQTVQTAKFAVLTMWHLSMTRYCGNVLELIVMLLCNPHKSGWSIIRYHWSPFIEQLTTLFTPLELTSV